MKKILIPGIIIIVGLLIFPFICKKEYIVLLKRDGELAHYNAQGELDGQIIIYKKGNIEKMETYKNGVREGICYDYYPSGQLESKYYYRSDKLTGPEIQYYMNGRINYIANTWNGKRIGSFYWYLNDGTFASYSTFDINSKTFFDVNYDKVGNIGKMDGFVVSGYMYSIDTLKKSIILLDFREKYKNIKDLYVIIATPPKTKPVISASINDTEYTNLKTDNGVLKINNAFTEKGLYKILIKCTLFGDDGKVINGLNSETVIIKE